MIHFTKYAEEKFDILRRHKVFVTKERVEEALVFPDSKDGTKAPLLFAQKTDIAEPGRALRVCYKMSPDGIKIITFYPVTVNDHEQ